MYPYIKNYLHIIFSLIVFNCRKNTDTLPIFIEYKYKNGSQKNFQQTHFCVFHFLPPFQVRIHPLLPHQPRNRHEGIRPRRPPRYFSYFFKRKNYKISSIGMGSHKKSSSPKGRAIKALPPPSPLGVNGHRFFFVFP